MVEVTSHSINPPTEDTLADIKILINSRIPLLVGGKVPVDISTSVVSMLATEATLGTMQADIALMKADLAAILAILES